MSGPDIHPEPVRRGRATASATGLMLVLLAFAAIPAAAVAQGMDAVLLAEMLREEGRRLPVRENGPPARGLRAASALARSLTIAPVCRAARVRGSVARVVDADRGFGPAVDDARPVEHFVRPGLLNLPPPRV